MTVASAALGACVESGASDRTASLVAPSATSTRIVTRDVEAPEVFQTAEKALWDGRPSLGGVWIASPDTKEPERVIIRNRANGKFVIGSLFRRAAQTDGPRLQISSDAAAALGMMAGQPSDVSVIALRREESKAAPDATRPLLDSAESLETTGLDPISAAAATAMAQSQRGVGPATPLVGAPSASKPTPVQAAPAPSGDSRVIQIGIFSVEANAQRAAAAAKAAGLVAEVKREQTQGKTLWSVTSRGTAAQLAKVKSLGIPDAYFLKR